MLMNEKENSVTNFILPTIDRKKCVLCGDCVEICPENVLILDRDQLCFSRPEACTFCAACEEICPEDAVRCAFEIRWSN